MRLATLRRETGDRLSRLEVELMALEITNLRFLDQMRRTLSFLGTLPEETIPDQARDDLLQAFRTWKQR